MAPMKTDVVGPALAAAEVARVVALLRAGQPVALPTETVYGLAAAAFDPGAVAGIFAAKGRPLFDPLIVHLPAVEWLERVVREVPPVARALAARFWPGPLTMVLPKAARVPDLVTAGLATVAVRMSAHPVFRRVIGEFGEPVAAPSANRFGRISPTTAEHVLAELGGRIPLIVDGGPCPHGIESTIVAVGAGGLEILRQGPVGGDELAAFGRVTVRAAGGPPTAPGQLAAHYAPRTPLRIVAPESVGPPPAGGMGRVGLLAWRRARPGFAAVEVLSGRGDWREAAAGFYGALRRLDGAGLDLIMAEELPAGGLGPALMERLGKAAHD